MLILSKCIVLCYNFTNVTLIKTLLINILSSTSLSRTGTPKGILTSPPRQRPRPFTAPSLPARVAVAAVIATRSMAALLATATTEEEVVAVAVVLAAAVTTTAVAVVVEMAGYGHSLAASVDMAVVMAVISLRLRPQTWAVNPVASTCPTGWFLKRLPILTLILIRRWCRSLLAGIIIIIISNSSSTT